MVSCPVHDLLFFSWFSRIQYQVGLILVIVYTSIILFRCACRFSRMPFQGCYELYIVFFFGLCSCNKMIIYYLFVDCMKTKTKCTCMLFTHSWLYRQKIRKTWNIIFDHVVNILLSAKQFFIWVLLVTVKVMAYIFIYVVNFSLNIIFLVRIIY